MRVRKSFRMRPVRLQSHYAAIFQAPVDSPLRIESNVFRTKTSASVQSLCAGQTRIAFKLSGKWRCFGRRPRGWRDGHRPKEEIEKKCGNDQDSAAKQSLCIHEVVWTFCCPTNFSLSCLAIGRSPRVSKGS